MFHADYAKKKKRKRASTKTNSNESKADDKLSKLLELKKELSSDLSDTNIENVRLEGKCDFIREENLKLSAEIEELRDILDTKHANSLPVATEKTYFRFLQVEAKSEEFIASNVSDATLDKYF